MSERDFKELNDSRQVFDIEKDYLHQIENIENQNYIDSEIPVADDISSQAIKKN